MLGLTIGLVIGFVCGFLARKGLNIAKVRAREFIREALKDTNQHTCRKDSR